jgi:deoxyribodipyrimidine photo-lyase
LGHSTENWTVGLPALRIRALNEAPVHAGRDFVLYWMIAARRVRSNFALERAIDHARTMSKPLVVLEALRCGYEWASDRLHTFVLQGMSDTAAALAGTTASYYPYVEPTAGAGQGLLEALAARAAVVVTDDYPAFFVPRMLAAAAARLEVRLEAVDGNGLVPLRATDRLFATAFSFRAFLQKTLRPHLQVFPAEHPLAGVVLPLAALPDAVTRRWPPASPALLSASPAAVAALPIDHGVSPAAMTGGARAAAARLRVFLRDRLARYPDERNQPEADVSSGLSPYLHFGHISAHEIFAALMTQEKWTLRRLRETGGGGREGWWGTSRAAEAFLDQLVTWRELGFNGCAIGAGRGRPGDDRYEALPDWARATLDTHARDPRPFVYTLAQFEAADTHDPLWNAAQTELVRDGRLHNYLRMLWGKKILEWSRTPREALATMIQLNNKYALDGRDPNSYSGIFWCLGRYDRPWGPERPIFGTVRYMSSENTLRKLRVKAYIRKYGPSSLID